MEQISSLKRLREDDEQTQTQTQTETQMQTQDEISKRQKSYKDIITLLEEDEDEPEHDLSLLISTLEEEISNPVHTGSTGLDRVEVPVQPGSFELDRVYSGSVESGSEEEDVEVEKVMKHLLEASDDELGIPNIMDGGDEVVGGHVEGGDLLLPGCGEGLWEFEDHEANNYYDEYTELLGSEIFI